MLSVISAPNMHEVHGKAEITDGREINSSGRGLV